MYLRTDVRWKVTYPTRAKLSDRSVAPALEGIASTPRAPTVLTFEACICCVAVCRPTCLFHRKAYPAHDRHAWPGTASSAPRGPA